MSDTHPPSDWPLDPEIIYLNHGAFGSCPRPVQEIADALRGRFERTPMQFVLRDAESLIDQARVAAASLMGADGEDLVFVQNASTGVSTVLASLPMRPGDELLTTDHAYNACRNALDLHARRTGMSVVVARVPFPSAGPDEVVAAVLGAVTARTRLALLDHVTSPTALVFPLAELVRELTVRGVDTLVDGAHAPGMLPLDLRALGATFYAANLHKWCGVPKTAAVLHVRRDRQADFHPLVIGHGANSPRTDRSRFLLEFDWIGTHDPSAAMSLPAALRYMSSLLPGGLPELQARNHDLVVRARALLMGALDLQAPCPPEMLGAMATLPLPARMSMPAPALYEALWRKHRIEAPVFDWLGRPMLRVCAQIYNDLPQYQKLAEAVLSELRS
ncbi:MAG TPA: aminotransferase class V-fold PLP-dependent enzyme [Polyangia bacterium]